MIKLLKWYRQRQLNPAKTSVEALAGGQIFIRCTGSTGVRMLDAEMTIEQAEELSTCLRLAAEAARAGKSRIYD